MFFLTLTGLVSVLWGASGVGPVVTEAELLKRLDGTSPAVVSTLSSLSSAKAESVAARAFDNPKLDLFREDPDGLDRVTEWKLSWQIPNSSRRLEISAADKSVEAQTKRVEHELRAVRSRLRADFARWAVAAARRDLLDRQSGHLLALASKERSRSDQGEISGLAAYRLELTASTLKARRSLAESDEQAARAELGRWVADIPAGARPELPPLPEASEASAAHPLIRAARLEADAAELNHRANERFISSPEVTLGWQRVEAFDSDPAGPIVGLRWTLPIFDRNAAGRAAAEARLERARAQVEWVDREVEARRSSAAARYEELRRGAQAAEAALAPHVEMLRGAEQSFVYGELELTGFLEVHRSVIDARLAWLELYDAALAAHRDLEEASTPFRSAASQKEISSSNSKE